MIIPTSYEKKNYILKDKEDLIILSKIRSLKNMNINNKDKEMIRLIKTQLKQNWRNPLINYLNNVIRRYK